MKAFVKSRWFSLAVVSVLFLGLLIFLYCIGFRITYPEEFETSWDAVSAVSSLLGAIGAIAAVWFAVVSTVKQYKISKKYQDQNKGLDLYPARRNALKLFDEKKYDDVYWDAVLLFQPEIADGIAILRLYVDCYKMGCELLEQYEQCMQNSEPELYKKYQLLMSEYEESENFDDIFELCDQFVPRVYMPEDDDYKILNYREIQDTIKRARVRINITHSDIMDMMRNEIINSIQ